jgi:hypothetical protein
VIDRVLARFVRAARTMRFTRTPPATILQPGPRLAGDCAREASRTLAVPRART